MSRKVAMKRIDVWYYFQGKARDVKFDRFVIQNLIGRQNIQQLSLYNSK